MSEKKRWIIVLVLVVIGAIAIKLDIDQQIADEGVAKLAAEHEQALTQRLEMICSSTWDMGNTGYTNDKFRELKIHFRDKQYTKRFTFHITESHPQFAGYLKLMNRPYRSDDQYPPIRFTWKPEPYPANWFFTDSDPASPYLILTK